MGTITLSGTTTPAAALLAQVIWDCLDSIGIKSPNSWPFAPDSLDFSGQGDPIITIDCQAGTASLGFFSTILNRTSPTAPVLLGTLDFAKLEAKIVTAPNYVDFVNNAQAGPSATLVFTSAAITKSKSGVVFITAGASGTQSAQQAPQMDLYRDYGTAGQTHLLGPWGIAPGGISGFGWLGRLTKIETLPDALPHSGAPVPRGFRPAREARRGRSVGAGRARRHTPRRWWRLRRVRQVFAWSSSFPHSLS